MKPSYSNNQQAQQMQSQSSSFSRQQEYPEQQQIIQQATQMNSFSMNQQLGSLKQQVQQTQKRQQQAGNQNKAKRQGAEFCEKHHEQNVAYIDGTNQLLCNACLYDKQYSDKKIFFTALMSKSLRAEYSQMFAEFRRSQQELGNVDPTVVKQRAQLIVQKFFTNLTETVKQQQAQVNDQIKNSDSLRDLEQILKDNSDMISMAAAYNSSKDQIDNFEIEKRKFDEKVGKGRFAYLVKKQDFYEQLIQSMGNDSNRMKDIVEKSQTQTAKVLQYKAQEAQLIIGEALSQIVRENIDVDLQECDPSRPMSTNLPSTSATDCLMTNSEAAHPLHSLADTALVNNSPSSSAASVSASIQSPQSRAAASQALPDRESSIFSGFQPNRQESMISQAQTQQINNQVAPQHIIDQQAQNESPLAKLCQNNVVSQASPIGKPTSNVVQSNNSPNQQEIKRASPRSSAGRQSSAEPQQNLNREMIAPSQVVQQVTQQASQDDDVQIIREVRQPQSVPCAYQPKQIAFITGAEIDFPAFFKLKSMSLLKLLPSRGWAKISPVQRYRAKCVQSKDESCFVIGGSTDDRSMNALADLLCYKIDNNRVSMIKKASMIQARSNFGVTINAHTIGKGEIYVAGGNIEGGTMTAHCEAYDIDQNLWRELPFMNEQKTSTSLSVMAGRYLYAIGGYSKDPVSGTGTALNSIEVLDLQHQHEAKWELLSLKLPHLILDMGSIGLSQSSLLLFGGWNRESQSKALILHRHNDSAAGHSIQHVSNNLEKPDFFMVTGVGMRLSNEPHKFKVCGHTQMFTFNTKTSSFEGSSGM